MHNQRNPSFTVSFTGHIPPEWILSWGMAFPAMIGAEICGNPSASRFIPHAAQKPHMTEKSLPQEDRIVHKALNSLSKMTCQSRRMFSVQLLLTFQSRITLSNELTRKEMHLAA